jgi:uncharacterized protein YoaH (UPF0181 family)
MAESEITVALKLVADQFRESTSGENQGQATPPASF